ncbi:MAG: PilZ domain-containing protein [Terracidiphilus sp.]|jgi:hypothetical protein
MEKFQPNIFLMGSKAMERDLEASEESKTPETPKRDEELRQSPRLGCRGFGAIQTLPASEQPCPARILNLSVGGCLMELKGPLDLAVDEIVELIFNVNQTPFRVRANVRILRSKGLVGFQFLQLSERTRRHLVELIGELIEGLVKLHKKDLASLPLKKDTNPVKKKYESPLSDHSPDDPHRR